MSTEFSPLKSALVLTACLASAAAHAGHTVVYPTGQWPADRDNIQTAINAGGQVLLKAINSLGAPTAFNLGTPEYLAGHDVYLDTNVEIFGERSGHANTTISGGLFPFRGSAAVSRVIHDVTFSGPMGGAMAFAASSNTLEIRNTRVTGVIPTPPRPNYPVAEAEGIIIYGQLPVTGSVVIDNNFLDLSAAPADFGFGIQVDEIMAAVRITSNHVLIGQSPGAGYDVEGIAAVRCHNRTQISGNTVEVGPSAYAGIGGYGSPDATFLIEGNSVVSNGPWADGIDLAGYSNSGQGISNGSIDDNVISMNGTMYAGISLYGQVSGVAVTDNRIAGNGQYALQIGQNFLGDLAAGNRFADNNVSHFASSTTDLFLDVNSTSTSAVDSCRRYIDLGVGDSVRCGH